MVVLDARPVQAGRTCTALRRAGHLVLGADDARTALQLVPSVDVVVADPRGDDPLLSTACAALSPHAVLVLYTDVAHVPPGLEPPRSDLFVVRGNVPGLLDAVAGRRRPAPT